MELKRKIESEFLPFVAKATRFLGNEIHSVQKDPGEGTLRLVLGYAGSYDSGIIHPEYDALYSLWNGEKSVWAERIYAYSPSDEEVSREHGVPAFSLESKTPVNQFPLIIFYLPNVLSILEVLTILDLSSISHYRSERNQTHSLIVGCGPGITAAECLTDFFDILLPGDAITGNCRLWQFLKTRDWKLPEKESLFHELLSIPGVYLPGLYKEEYSSYGELLAIKPNSASVPTRIEMFPEEELERMTVNIAPLVPLGSVNSRNYFPGDWRLGSESESVKPLHRLQPISSPSLASFFRDTLKILRMAGSMGVDQLISFNQVVLANSWLYFKKHSLLGGKTIRLSLPDYQWHIGVYSGKEFLSVLKENAFYLFCGPASNRLRRLAGFQLREEDIINIVKGVQQQGWRKIYLTVLVDFPTEKMSDWQELVKLLRQMKADAGEDVDCLLSLEGFYPQPFTPFQWERPARSTKIEEIGNFLRNELNDSGIQIVQEIPRLAEIYTVLYRGGRPSGKVLYDLWKQGARFQYQKEFYNSELWEAVLSEQVSNISTILNPLSISATLPWEHLDSGRSKSSLREEKNRAFQGEIDSERGEMLPLGRGISRREFQNLIQRSLSASAISYESPGVDSKRDTNETTSTIKYGRRGKKRQTPTAVIKRRIRVRYSKVGLARFFSYIDITGIFDRAIRLAKIPVVESQGKKKTLKISYGMPLPAGIASIAEYLDLEVALGKEIELKEQLNPYLPEGIQILQYKGIFRKVPSLASVVNQVTYEVKLPEAGLSQSQIDDWLAQDEVWIERPVKEGVKQVEIRSYVDDILLEGTNLQVRINIKEDRTAKITEVLESLLTPLGIDYRRCYVQRTGQFIVTENEVLTPFDVI